MKRDCTNVIARSAVAIAAAGIVSISAANAAEITILASPAVEEVYVELVPSFEHATQRFDHLGRHSRHLEENKSRRGF